jgi:hypothetical protein
MRKACFTELVLKLFGKVTAKIKTKQKNRGKTEKMGKWEKIILDLTPVHTSSVKDENEN